MYFVSYLSSRFHSFHDFFFTRVNSSVQHTDLILKKIYIFQRFWPGFCTSLFSTFRKEASTKDFYKMFKFYFENQYSIQRTIKRGAVFYIALALLAVPAGLCSQQHQIPDYDPTAAYWNAISHPVAEFFHDYDLALLDTPFSEDDPGVANADGELGSVEIETEEPSIDTYISKAAETYQVDAALIKAVIMAESGYNPRAVSHRGAQGLMQLMPNTARWLGVEDAFDPALNIDGGVRYLRRLIDRFKGDIKLALAAYNAGSRYVRKYGGVPPFRATRIYVRKVLNLREGYLKEMADLPSAPSAV